MLDADAFCRSMSDDWKSGDEYVYMKRLVETHPEFSDCASDHFLHTVAAFQPKRLVGVEILQEKLRRRLSGDWPIG